MFYFVLSVIGSSLKAIKKAVKQQGIIYANTSFY